MEGERSAEVRFASRRYGSVEDLLGRHARVAADGAPFGAVYREALAYVVSEAAGGDDASRAGARVLHLGCSVGGGSFALAAHFGRVVGVDAGEPRIRAARILQHHGQLECAAGATACGGGS